MHELPSDQQKYECSGISKAFSFSTSIWSHKNASNVFATQLMWNVIKKALDIFFLPFRNFYAMYACWECYVGYLMMDKNPWQHFHPIFGPCKHMLKSISIQSGYPNKYFMWKLSSSPSCWESPYQTLSCELRFRFVGAFDILLDWESSVTTTNCVKLCMKKKLL